MKKKLLYMWDHLEEIFLLPAFTLSTALIFLQVIMRYVFKNSLSWSEELVRYLYVWETWIGCSYATHKCSQLRITMIKDKLSPKAQNILEIFVTIVWIAFAAFVFYQSYRAIGTIVKFGQKSAALQIPMQYPYLAIPVGMTLMVIRLVENSIKTFVHKDTKAEEGAAE